MAILCGRYEGVDERVRQHLATEEISIGDYVLSGGELAALVIVDAVARLVPGVVGDEQSVSRDSFATGLLDFPQYTRPAEFDGNGRAAGAGLGASWRDRAVAQARGARADAGAAAGPAGERAALTAEDRELLDELLEEREERRSSQMTAVETVERANMVQRPAIKPGDTVRVHVKVREGDKERIQVFEGMVIGMHRGGARATFTVRKVSFGQGVERIFPLHSPIIDKIDVLRTARVRRAKLYFLRELKGKAARMRGNEATQKTSLNGISCRLLVSWSRFAPSARWRTLSGAWGSTTSPASTRSAGAVSPARSSPRPSSSIPTVTSPGSAIPRP